MKRLKIRPSLEVQGGFCTGEMWSSQDWSQDSQSTDAPPRDMLAPRGISPKRKKRPTSHFQSGGLTGINFKMFGQGTQSRMSQDSENVPLQPTVFGISQESMGASQSQFSQSQQYSQMSQDFTDRMGGLAVHDINSYPMNDDSMCYSQSGPSAFKKDEDEPAATGGSGGGGAASSQGLSLASAFKQQKQSQSSLPRSGSNFDGGHPGLTINTSFTNPALPPMTQEGSGIADRGTPMSATGAPDITFPVPQGYMPTRDKRDVNSSSSGNNSTKNSSRRHTDGEDLGRKSRLILLRVPNVNPFIEPYTQRKGAAKDMWVKPFEERPRLTSDFEQIDVLGEGQFSVVLYARKRLDGQVYAIKKLKTQIMGDKGGNRMAREVYAHAALQGCPNLAQYYNAWLDDHILHIQTELCVYGSLERLVAALPLKNSSGESRDVNVSGERDPDETQDVDAMSDDEHANNSFDYGTQASQEVDSEERNTPPSLMKKTKMAPAFAGVPESVAWMVLSKTARTLAFMHAKQMVHLDVRPSNIFIASGSGKNNLREKDGKLVTDIAPDQIVEWLLSGEAVIKVGDLGQCCAADEENVEEGEARYCSRELINGEAKDVDLYKADIFSLGASVYELILGRRLLSAGDDSNEWHELRGGVLAPHLADNYSQELLDTLRKSMDVLSSNRPSAQEVMELCQRRAFRGEMDARAVSPTASETQRMNSLLLELQHLRSENECLKKKHE